MPRNKNKKVWKRKKRERGRDVTAKNKELKRIRKAEKAVMQMRLSRQFRLLYSKILQAQAQTLIANKNKKLA